MRRRREGGSEWGEAILAEFHQTTGSWEAVRWAAGGLRAVRLERRNALPRVVRIRRRVALVGVLGVLGGALVNQYVLTVDVVLSGSMQPGYEILDRYVVDRVAFRATGVDHGDVITFTWPGTTRTLVKRVIGLPGDTISCQGGRVYRNGVALDEPYLFAQADEPGTECATVTVPAGDLYLLGDHRSVSEDSRQEGFVPTSNVTGRVLTVLVSGRTLDAL
ncbi:signal peptidase I [Actinoplanes sp. NPDC051851]|uniref:signal peptidase I n=1 Tax=Actinoplanes sp. NPDC051851 TaxID=3154753 RepID=UPI003434C04A